MIRGGVLSVPPGQREAAMALGLPRWLIGWKIVAPQAARVIIPPAGTQFVSMLKDSALVSLMGLWELNFLAQSYGRSSFHYMEMLISAAAIYWLLSLGFELVQVRLERRFGRGFAPGTARARASAGRTGLRASGSSAPDRSSVRRIARHRRRPHRYRP
ncbi:MAG: ABC transporter permease subunit [Aliidongia sp.]